MCEAFSSPKLTGVANKFEPPGVFTERPTKAIINAPLTSASPIHPQALS